MYLLLRRKKWAYVLPRPSHDVCTGYLKSLFQLFLHCSPPYRGAFHPMVFRPLHMIDEELLDRQPSCKPREAIEQAQKIVEWNLFDPATKVDHTMSGSAGVCEEPPYRLVLPKCYLLCRFFRWCFCQDGTTEEDLTESLKCFAASFHAPSPNK